MALGHGDADQDPVDQYGEIVAGVFVVTAQMRRIWPNCCVRHEALQCSQRTVGLDG